LRGKGAQTAWLDDLTNWQDGRGMAAFMQVYRNLREGDGRGVVTFNPAETELIRWILKVDNPMIVRTHSVSDVNLGSLSLRSLDQWSLIEGTEEARRDRGGELPDKSDRSPFHGIDFDKCRVGPVDPAEMLETIIAIDPSDNDLKTSDECGLIAMGKDRNGHVYLLEDRSGCVKPDVWGARAIAMADRWKASAFVAENNRGESDVRAVLNAAYWRDRAEMGQSGLGALPPIVGVCAMRGKFLRAEPVRALYLTRRIHHAGTFPELEKQMASMDPTAPKRPKQDDRADAAVHGATHLAGLNATVKNTPPRGQPFRVPGWS
jgi:phage terminase large subunit-like protein